MDVPRTLAALLQREGLTQTALAERAHVSQASVSRALRRVPTRNSPEYARLCSYIQIVQDGAARPREATDALTEIWDGSSAHDQALATLIQAVGGVTRSRTLETESDQPYER